MVRPRWRKLAGDARAERGRIALMIAAVAVSLVAVGAVLGGYAVLEREIAVNYLGTRPAQATLEVGDGADPALVAAVRARPEVVEAEAREVVLARARVGDQWRRMLLFVIDDFDDLRLNRFRRERGAWPPPTGTMLIERTASGMLAATIGGSVVIETAHGQARPVAITGVVHDPGLAPAWQERSGYGYLTRATLAGLGEPAVLHELRVEFAGRLDGRAIEERANQLATWLAGQGHPVSEIRVPPPGQHPHQRQMETILLMMLAFSTMALVLSAILVASSLAAMLARQVREIGVMKTVGARTGQIAAMYLVQIGLLGLVATALAIPLGTGGAHLLAGAVSSLLNFDLTSTAIPGWVYAVQLVAGIAVPLVVAAVPIARASRTTVRQAIDDHGVSNDRPSARWRFLPAPLRNAVRRPGRLVLTLGLLAAGGAMFMTALDVERGWRANADKLTETRSYDVEVVLHEPAPAAVAERLRRLPQVREVERWGASPAAFARPGTVDVVRTYPDRGHGSLQVLAPPVDTGMIRLPVTAGRWLRAGDRDCVVLNHVARAQAGGPAVGDPVALSFAGQVSALRLCGVVEEVGAAGVAYVTPATFAAAAGTGDRARMLRITTRASGDGERAAAIAAIEDALAGAGVQSAMPLAELRTALGDHITILIRALIAMAVILAIVGVLGLGSAMGVSVVERTRELGVMKTLGATPGRIVRALVVEGALVGLISFGLAAALSLPLTWFVDRLIGNLGFLAPLPFIVSPGAAAIWFGLVAVSSVAATLVPARRGAALTIREALIQT